MVEKEMEELYCFGEEGCLCGEGCEAREPDWSDVGEELMSDYLSDRYGGAWIYSGAQSGGGWERC